MPDKTGDKVPAGDNVAGPAPPGYRTLSTEEIEMLVSLTDGEKTPNEAAAAPTESHEDSTTIEQSQLPPHGGKSNLLEIAALLFALLGICVLAVLLVHGWYA